jgi:hypothetical protein
MIGMNRAGVSGKARDMFRWSLISLNRPLFTRSKHDSRMEQASRLSMYIYVRVNYPVYHPKRILMAKSDHSTEVFEEDMPLKDDEG